MDNIHEFDKFRNSLPYKNHGDLHLTFPAKVAFDYKGKTEHETLNVTLKYDTLTYGQISIANGKNLTPEKVHLDFNPDYQEYLYKNEGVLKISGSSSKMGKYEATIMCLRNLTRKQLDTFDNIEQTN